MNTTALPDVIHPVCGAVAIALTVRQARVSLDGPATPRPIGEYHCPRCKVEFWEGPPTLRGGFERRRWRA
jgi:hypothetical protein